MTPDFHEKDILAVYKNIEIANMSE